MYKKDTSNSRHKWFSSRCHGMTDTFADYSSVENREIYNRNNLTDVAEIFNSWKNGWLINVQDGFRRDHFSDTAPITKLSSSQLESDLIQSFHFMSVENTRPRHTKMHLSRIVNSVQMRRGFDNLAILYRQTIQSKCDIKNVVFEFLNTVFIYCSIYIFYIFKVPSSLTFLITRPDSNLYLHLRGMQSRRWLLVSGNLCTPLRLS